MKTHLAAVVVEHSGDVLFGKSSSGVGDEETGLPHSTVTYYHTLYSLHDDLWPLTLQQPATHTHTR